MSSRIRHLNRRPPLQRCRPLFRLPNPPLSRRRVQLRSRRSGCVRGPQLFRCCFAQDRSARALCDSLALLFRLPHLINWPPYAPPSLRVARALHLKIVAFSQAVLRSVLTVAALRTNYRWNAAVATITRRRFRRRCHLSFRLRCQPRRRHSYHPPPLRRCRARCQRRYQRNCQPLYHRRHQARYQHHRRVKRHHRCQAKCQVLRRLRHRVRHRLLRRARITSCGLSTHRDHLALPPR